jgi:hypothetical protein
MAFTTKLDFSSNRQVKQHEKTRTYLSGATSFGLTFTAMTSGPDSSTSAVTQTINSITSTFSGNTGATNYSWYDGRMSLGESALSAITPSISGITQITGPVFTSDTTTIIDNNNIVLSYSGVDYTVTVTAMDDLGGGSYSGTISTTILNILSANTLDYTGRTIWNDVSGITRTERLIITNNPQIGYVWTCIDSEGMGEWQYNSSATTATIWTAGTGVNSAVLAGSGGIASNTNSVSEGRNTIASGYASHAEGMGTIASGDYSHAEGMSNSTSSTIASGIVSHAEGIGTIASGDYSHAEGQTTQATGSTSHAEGAYTKAYGDYSHAEGSGSKALNSYSHAEGMQTTASGGFGSHSEGSNTIASGSSAHSEGMTTIAGGQGSHAEGFGTQAIGSQSHSEGDNTLASGISSHAEGGSTIAYGQASHAGGQSNISYGLNSFTHFTGNLVSGYNQMYGSSGDTSAILGGIEHTIHIGSTNSVIIGGSNNVVNPSVLNSIVLGGSSISATTSDYVYVPSLNIKTIGSSAFANDVRITANGDLTTNTSDERLKENITPITRALDIIKSLNGVNYQWKDRSAGGDDIKLGFIAQQVELVEPKLIFTNKVDGYKGLHIDGIIPLLVEAVKELSSGVITSNNAYLETQTILAEDNNIELNYSGTPTTAIGGGIRVLHALGIDDAAELITDSEGNFITNNDFKSKALTIPLYTPTSSTDVYGSEGNITRDDNYLYIKGSTGWKRTNLESF